MCGQEELVSGGGVSQPVDVLYRGGVVCMACVVGCRDRRLLTGRTAGAHQKKQGRKAYQESRLRSSHLDSPIPCHYSTISFPTMPESLCPSTVQ